MAQSPPLHSLLGQDHWIFPQGWGWAGHPDSTSPASSSDSSGSCPCDGSRGPSQPAPQARSARAAECPLCPDGGPAQTQTQTQVQARAPALGSAASPSASWGSPPACPEALAAPERLGSRIPDMGPWVTPPYHPGMQSPPQLSRGRGPDAALWTPPQGCSGTQTSPESRNQATPWTPSPAAPELAVIYQGISVSPESCLLPETPPLLSRPACQRLQPQTEWGCWSHSAEMLPASEDQGPGPAFQLGDESPSQSSGVQLSGCPELWQEDLEGAHLGIFY
ncbi:mesoderm posterior protein 2 [Herpailurus yagouaroundi]|uniref:mesoderm posterior protein 2 n=1 Tax=Herpailurus yagouaroundi TaxID=1608482 RepID=UPI001AD6A5DE|nr:mesoderm posterior protein 2 [Puma yagouaroundi]